MNRDELDRAVARLFGAARDEQPAPEVRRAARERAREAVAEAPRPAWPWPVGLAIAAAVLGAVLVRVFLPRGPVAELSPDPALVQPSIPLVVTSSQPANEVQRSPTPPTSAQSARPAPSVLPPTLEEELTALRDVRAALDAGDSGSALEQLDHYDRRGRRLRAEATMLRIEALSSASRAEEAAALARRFVTENPAHPLVDRARTFIPQTTNTEP